MEYPTKQELDAEREALVAEIYDAFKNVLREGGVSWSESEVIDFYGSPEERAGARRKDTDIHWSQLVDDKNWSTEPGVGGYSFLDAIGFRYYLPPGMLRCLRSGYDEGICFHLSDPGQGLLEHKRNQQSLLDDRQRRCVAQFLLYMVKEAGHSLNANNWRKALNCEWRRYLES